MLLPVFTTIPHARRLEIARNRKIDQFDNDIDVVVYAEFDNETEVGARKAHGLC
ncbi:MULTISPECIES: Dabb family protein [Bradyrhizobium]|jgi:hypothetical protein|uniref:Stress-response A/B barrel domain-containing protein n=1 Tax=Bradyrhizobium elkanii TaxID=29448 RepID=A0A4Q4K6Y5_BRAEL|nr:hypothetical protein [Bradyrhizobium elkanii]MCS4007149.1 hypothetical protein [Bradyrhizobium elkanii USDA 61]NLS73232.1 hypothetical protein [Bradyrhizobium brasilense]QOZ15687.1 hypothetical protein XI02_12380 [Bradyrhizobium sp. CCBAU 21365]UQD79762.1 Dabb family protein [Bradyrhizobium elkanii USDA 76]